MTSPNRAATSTSGKYAYAGLDRVIHEKARLGIMTSLVARPAGVAFTDLKDLCDLTDGNLNFIYAVHQKILRTILLNFLNELKEGHAVGGTLHSLLRLIFS